MSLSAQEFQAFVKQYYVEHGRDLPWRTPSLQPDNQDRLDPYRIMVSEIMLQQTQVSRVIGKYQEFLAAFPTIQTLAEAPLGAVLQLWSGLGYNRRAKFLHAAAQHIAGDLKGVFPDDAEGLVALPGIGVNTAGAIVAYAFNKPAIFIETNIRTVYIHYFFADATKVADAELVPWLTQTMDAENPREWYWALMDLGSVLKKEVGNASRSSKSYVKQSTFEGSKRQLRGRMLRELMAGPMPRAALLTVLDDNRSETVLLELIDEKLVQITADNIVSLPY